MSAGPSGQPPPDSPLALLPLPRMSASDSQPFVLRGEYITLDALLKAANVCSSGGAAKAMIGEGEVSVDGEVETRRGRKLRAGQRVEVAGLSLRIEADPVGRGDRAMG